MNHGSKPNITDNAGIPPLERAIHLHHDQAVELLLNSNKVDYTANRNGYSYMHAAAAQGNMNLLKKLITIELDVEQKDNDGAGFTPLHWATQENKEEVVRELLKNGADPKVSLLVYIGASNGYTDIVEDLIHEGADIEIMNEAVSNFTPLLIACTYDQLEVVKLLLNKNANIHEVSSEGKSVLLFLLAINI